MRAIGKIRAQMAGTPATGGFHPARKIERQRWLHRAGASGRRDRSAAGPDEFEGIATPQSAASAGFRLRGRRPGHRAVAGGIMKTNTEFLRKPKLVVLPVM